VTAEELARRGVALGAGKHYMTTVPQHLARSSAVTSGLPNSEFVSFADAEQWLACGAARSLWPDWLREEELALAPIIETFRREMQETDNGRVYPPALVNIGRNPATIIATLEAHRGNWPPSGQALYDAAIEAAIARAKKDARLQEANRLLIHAVEAGEMPLYGLWFADQEPRFGRIHFPVTVNGLENMRVTLDIVVRDGTMYPDPTSPWSSELERPQQPLYQALSFERRTLIEWASRLGADTSTDAEGVPPSGEGVVPASPEEAPTNLPDDAINSTRQTNTDADRVPPAGEKMVSPSPEARSLSLPDDTIHSTPQASADTEKVSPADNKRRRVYPVDIARMALNALTGVHEMTDKELEGQVADWIKVENPKRIQKRLPPWRMMSIRTIKRAMGKK
jgi:hypothetical protein